MQTSIDELNKIHDSMPRHYVEALKEYKNYLETNSIGYLTRRKHMKKYILQKLNEKGYEITEETEKTILEISKACKIYALENKCADLFEILLCGNAGITYGYITAMNTIQMAKNYEPLMRDVDLDLKKLEKDIAECKKCADAKIKNMGAER